MSAGERPLFWLLHSAYWIPKSNELLQDMRFSELSPPKAGLLRWACGFSAASVWSSKRRSFLQVCAIWILAGEATISKLVIPELLLSNARKRYFGGSERAVSLDCRSTSGQNIVAPPSQSASACTQNPQPCHTRTISILHHFIVFALL